MLNGCAGYQSKRYAPHQSPERAQFASFIIMIDCSQIYQAEHGDVPSQVALGDTYYWGARGVQRDQVRALRYFKAAANAGDNTARCAAAVSALCRYSCS